MMPVWPIFVDEFAKRGSRGGDGRFSAIYSERPSRIREQTEVGYDRRQAANGCHIVCGDYNGELPQGKAASVSREKRSPARLLHASDQRGA